MIGSFPITKTVLQIKSNTNEDSYTDNINMNVSNMTKISTIFKSDNDDNIIISNDNNMVTSDEISSTSSSKSGSNEQNSHINEMPIFSSFKIISENNNYLSKRFSESSATSDLTAATNRRSSDAIDRNNDGDDDDDDNDDDVDLNNKNLKLNLGLIANKMRGFESNKYKIEDDNVEKDGEEEEEEEEEEEDLDSREYWNSLMDSIQSEINISLTGSEYRTENLILCV